MSVRDPLDLYLERVSFVREETQHIRNGKRGARTPSGQLRFAREARIGRHELSSHPKTKLHLAADDANDDEVHGLRRSQWSWTGKAYLSTGADEEIPGPRSHHP